MIDGLALVLLSGGQDSSTCLLWAVKNFSEVKAVTFNYGQKHDKELQSASDVADYLEVEETVIHLSTFHQITTSTLLKHSKKNPNSGNLPATFIPGRNIVLLTYAAILAQKLGGHILVGGMCQTDFSGYPDCRREVIDLLEGTLSVGMDWEIKILTPLMNLTKGQSILLIKEYPEALPVLRLTHTCYRNEFPPCGECDSCKLRAKGFAEVNMKDPLYDWED